MFSVRHYFSAIVLLATFDHYDLQWLMIEETEVLFGVVPVSNSGWRPIFCCFLCANLLQKCLPLALLDFSVWISEAE